MDSIESDDAFRRKLCLGRVISGVTVEHVGDIIFDTFRPISLRFGEIVVRTDVVTGVCDVKFK